MAYKYFLLVCSLFFHHIHVFFDKDQVFNFNEMQLMPLYTVLLVSGLRTVFLP